MGELFLAYPIIAALLLLIFKSRLLNFIVLAGYAILHLTLATLSFFQLAHPLQHFHFQLLTIYLQLDAAGALFLIVLSILFAGITLYSLIYLKNSDNRWNTYYTVFLTLFVLSMDGVILSTHLGLLWVFIETTTLTSAVLIYFEKTKAALEAAWKYIFICSIGIALSLVGIILLSIANAESLFLQDVYAQAGQLSIFWLRLAFLFILIGFGTKMGLAPVHAWLPDAHSEAPSPVSALLSGALLNTAFLGIMRVFKILNIAGIGNYAQNLFLIMGFLSLFISAVFILRIENYKRILAYSSIENMGIIVIGAGFGGIGLFASMLHLVAHSLTKASLFLTAGNILHRYRTKQVTEISGLVTIDPITGWLWLCGFLSISAIPPFASFLSEFFILKSIFEQEHYALAVAFCLLLTFIIYGMGKSFLRMVFSNPTSAGLPQKNHVFTYLPQLLFLIGVLALGLYIPDSIRALLQAAANAFLP